MIVRKLVRSFKRTVDKQKLSLVYLFLSCELSWARDCSGGEAVRTGTTTRVPAKRSVGMERG